jgi:hypothetical protein
MPRASARECAQHGLEIRRLFYIRCSVMVRYKEGPILWRVGLLVMCILFIATPTTFLRPLSAHVCPLYAHVHHVRPEPEDNHAQEYKHRKCLILAIINLDYVYLTNLDV